jgi:hypothetical protein
MIEVSDWVVRSVAIGSNEGCHINAATLEVTHDRSQQVWLYHTLTNHLSIVELNNHHIFHPLPKKCVSGTVPERSITL